MSILALIVSAATGLATAWQVVEAHRQGRQSAQINADMVITRFTDMGSILGKTPFCYKYALSLTDPGIRAVFAEKMESIPVRPNDANDLKTCLGTHDDIEVLQKHNLDKFRTNTQLKMNSYENAFSALRSGLGQDSIAAISPDTVGWMGSP